MTGRLTIGVGPCGRPSAAIARRSSLSCGNTRYDRSGHAAAPGSATPRISRSLRPAIAELALALREIVLEEAPDASESIYQVYTVAIWFGFSGKMKDMFCYIATNARHVNLGFPQGASLPDPNRVLEGSGKAMRHIKFAGLHDVERPFVRRYIQAAMERAAPAGTRGSGQSVVRSSLATTKTQKRRARPGTQGPRR